MIRHWKGVEAQHTLRFFYDPSRQQWLRDTTRIDQVELPEDLEQAAFGSDIAWTPPWDLAGGPVEAICHYLCSGHEDDQTDPPSREVHVDPQGVTIGQDGSYFGMQPKFWRAEVIWSHAEPQIIEHAAAIDWMALATA